MFAPGGARFLMVQVPYPETPYPTRLLQYARKGDGRRTENKEIKLKKSDKIKKLENISKISLTKNKKQVTIRPSKQERNKKEVSPMG